ncbi:hypothetical protein [Lacinutrix jangbogonensis]|uniref:hypothetical protein n=1 Tax=Lacinutrix jangbogonensis TaxID=1469557 RepID=UPI00053D40C3|nr:hypothetical protein [Lacinutrix jangbogonensis]
MFIIKFAEAKGFIDVFVPFEKEVVKQNTEQLFKRYKKQFNGYLLPDIPKNDTQEEEAFMLLERIRKKDISPQFIINCELQFVEYCKEFILIYDYFDEDYYIIMDEVFESACLKIKDENLIEEYRIAIKILIEFGNEYGLEFSEICKTLVIYKTLL